MQQTHTYIAFIHTGRPALGDVWLMITIQLRYRRSSFESQATAAGRSKSSSHSTISGLCFSSMLASVILPSGVTTRPPARNNSLTVACTSDAACLLLHLRGHAQRRRADKKENEKNENVTIIPVYR